MTRTASASKQRRRGGPLTASIAAIACCTVALVLVTARTASAQDSLVTTVGEPTTRVIPHDPAIVMGFPVTVNPAVAEVDIDADVMSVTRGGVAVAADAIKVNLNRDTGRIELQIEDPAATATTGNYVVDVLLTADDGAKQALAFTLSRPAAALTAGATIEIEKTGGFLGLGSSTLPSSETVELNLGRGAPLSGLTARQVERPAAGHITLYVNCPEPDDGQAVDIAECDALSAADHVLLDEAVAQDAVLRLHYELDDFPLGSSTRTVEVRSPQLAGETTLTFEVTNRRTPLWIPSVVILGIFFGLLLRVVLVQVINAARLQRVRKQFAARTRGLKDRFSADLGFVSELEKIEAEKDPRKTLEGIDAQRAVVRKLYDAAQTKLATVADSYNTAAGQLRGDYRLPQAVGDALANHQVTLDAVRDMLEARNGPGAERELVAGGPVSVSAQRMIDAADDWSDLYLSRVKALETALRDDAVAAAPDELLMSLAEAAEQATLPDDPKVSDHLLAIDRLLGDFERDVAVRLEDTIASRRSRSEALAERAADALRSETGAAERIAAVTEPLVELAKVPEEVEQEAARTPLEAEARRELDAREAVKAPATPPTGQAVTVTLPSFDLPAGAGVLFGAAGVALTTVEWFAVIVRSIAVALIVAVGSYAIRADDWVGTFSDMFSLFGWAFAIDLSVQSLQQVFAPEADQGDDAA